MTSNLNRQLRKMKSSLIVYLCLKTAAPASTKAERVDKDGQEELAHCGKRSRDSVELADLCKLLFLTI